MPQKLLSPAAARFLQTVLVLVLLFAGYIAVEAICACRANPPATVQTFDSYLQWQTKPRGVRLQDLGGQTYVLMYGPNAGLFPSGPPIYVFDWSGRLVDWTTDSGDDPRFQSKWLATPRPRDSS